MEKNIMDGIASPVEYSTSGARHHDIIKRQGKAEKPSGGKGTGIFLALHGII
jgi:hypothetical protein